MLDPRLPGRTERPLRAVPALLLEHLGVFEEQGSGQEPIGSYVAAVFSREACCSQRRLRFAGVREADNSQDMGGREPPEGDALPLSQSVQPPGPVDRRGAGAAEDCPADLYPGDPDQDVPEVPPRRGDGKNLGLGGMPLRRLHSELMRHESLAAVTPTGVAAAD